MKHFVKIFLLVSTMLIYSRSCLYAQEDISKFQPVKLNTPLLNIVQVDPWNSIGSMRCYINDLRKTRPDMVLELEPMLSTMEQRQNLAVITTIPVAVVGGTFLVTNYQKIESQEFFLYILALSAGVQLIKYLIMPGPNDIKVWIEKHDQLLYPTKRSVDALGEKHNTIQPLFELKKTF